MIIANTCGYFKTFAYLCRKLPLSHRIICEYVQKQVLCTLWGNGKQFEKKELKEQQQILQAATINTVNNNNRYGMD